MVSSPAQSVWEVDINVPIWIGGLSPEMFAGCDVLSFSLLTEYSQTWETLTANTTANAFCVYVFTASHVKNASAIANANARQLFFFQILRLHLRLRGLGEPGVTSRGLAPWSAATPWKVVFSEVKKKNSGYDNEYDWQ